MLLVCALHPGRGRAAEDHAVARFQLRGQEAREVPQLRGVELAAELGVQADQPPPVRQLHREVAAVLARAPATDGPSLGEHPEERREPVVPVVVPRQHEHRRRVRRVRQGGPVRALHPVVVLLRRGRGVDLVAPEDEHAGTGQRPDRLPAGRRLRLEPVGSKQPGDGARGVEPVAQVGDEVQPELAPRRRHLELRGLECLLDLALVGVAGEDRRQHDLDAGPPQLTRREPAHGVFGPEAQVFFAFPQVGDLHTAPPPMRFQRAEPGARAHVPGAT